MNRLSRRNLGARDQSRRRNWSLLQGKMHCIPSYLWLRRYCSHLFPSIFYTCWTSCAYLRNCNYLCHSSCILANRSTIASGVLIQLHQTFPFVAYSTRHLVLFYNGMQVRYDSVTQISLDLPSDRSDQCFIGDSKVLATPSWVANIGFDHNRRHLIA